ncbi:MAG TPA: adenylate/guanylate cyclase domain-containing protein [Burkholderiales bacterium]|nr:adenylate/guanylate cyclase domain-containing protein [Burkholderiales bacterium]HYA46822.1 adenylate/guanylate cyclase domain-containing protein [Burkholderiales bacterium]
METSSRTLVCCVVFLDIAEYSRKPVSEQLQLKQAFNGILADAVAQVPPRDRIILDTGDGAAITFLGDPEDALFAAMSIRDSSGSLAVRIGVNLGPVRLLKDLNGQMNIIGDGINVAQRVMGFAQPGQLLVSRSFYEVVSRLSRDYTRLFTHVGLRTDKHVREHEVYAVISGPTAARRVEETMSRVKRTQRAGGWFSAPGPAGLHRGALVAAPLVFLLFAGSGIALRAGMHGTNAPPATTAENPLAESAPPVPKAGQEPAPAADAVKQGAAPPAVKEPPRAAPSQAPAPAHKPTKANANSGKQRPLASTEEARSKAAPPPSGTIQLAISPWGEIVVDGTKRGVSPPLRELELPAGMHTIEIRNTTFPARIETVTVRSGESIRVRHQFR